MHSISKKAKQEYMRIKAVACVVAAFFVFILLQLQPHYTILIFKFRSDNDIKKSKILEDDILILKNISQN